jgi:putative DNA primase/helicase
MQRGLYQKAFVAVSPSRWDNDYYIASMLEQRLNTVSEIPSAEVFVSDAFKAFITGDQVTGRHPSGRPFDFNPIAGHVFSANELPATGDVSEGFWRRFLVVEFTARFSGGSKANIVEPILASELPGVFNWAVEGALEALKQKEYTLPLSHTHAMNVWKKDADALLSFVACAGDTGGDIWTPFAEVYEDYLHWTALTRHGTMSANKFARRLVSAGVPKKRLADTTYYKIRMKERRFWVDVPGGGEVELKVVETKEKSSG